MTARATFNVYCDESCHLERDGHPLMVIGAVTAPSEHAAEINAAIRALKAAHGHSPDWETKWTSVSASRLPFYLDLVDLFVDRADLAFRAVIAPKNDLRHAEFNQTHDDWYYKIYYQTLMPILSPKAGYRIYIDIKDTRGGPKAARLRDILATKLRDWDGEVVQRIQIQRSDEIQLLQLADFLIGAVGYRNRRLETSAAKLAVVRRLEERMGLSLLVNTNVNAPKVNLLHWRPRPRQ